MNYKIIISSIFFFIIYRLLYKKNSKIYNYDIIIEPGQKSLIPTGFALSIPKGYEIQIRPRSGLAAKKNISVLNTPGTVDSDYRGEIKVIIY